MRGVPCEVLDNVSGQIVRMCYFIDPCLQRVTVRRGAKWREAIAGAIYREVEVAAIVDVYDLEAATSFGRSLVPESVLRQHSDAVLRDRLAVIAIEGGAPSLCILEGSTMDRDRIVVCLKVLRIYAQTYGREDGHSLGTFALSA
jgi:hypothetical protein